MTRVSRIFAWTAAAVALLVAVLVVLLATFDWNRLKPTINERVSEALGRPFEIAGELSVDWRAPWAGGPGSVLPWPHITARELTVGNPQWAKTPHLATLRQVSFALSPWPLLRRRVAIAQVALGEPSVNLERREDGRNNWTFHAGGESGESSAWQLDIGEIAFDQARVGLDDGQRDARLELVVDPLGQPIPFGALTDGRAGAATVEPHYAFGWQAHGTHRGQRVRGSGRLGGLLALNDLDRPFPLQMDLRVGATRIALAGTLTDPRDLAALDLKLRLSGASMSELYPLIGVTLPDTPSYATDGRLVARLREPDGAVFRYEEFTGRVGESDLRGSLHYLVAEPRPRLSGTLTSRQLRLVDLGPLIGLDGGPDGEPAPSGKALPEQEFRTERWAAMDADVRFTGTRIVRGEALPLTDVDTRLRLDGGLLRLDPLKFGMADGHLQGTLRLDGRASPMAGRVDIAARHLKLKSMFPTFEPMQTSLGELNAEAELAGRGNSVAALLGSADGAGRLLVSEGTMSRDLMELAGLNIGRYVVDQLFGDEQVRLNCLLADLAVADGVVRPQVFLIDTENAVVRVGGTVALGSERLDLEVRPESKGMRILSLRSPLYVRGSFREPDVGVHKGPLVARGAGMAALGAVAGPLAALLALIAPGGGEGDRCSDVLRSLGERPDGRRP